MKIGLPRALLCRVVLQWKLAGKFEVHIMGENTKSMYHKFCGTYFLHNKWKIVLVKEMVEFCDFRNKLLIGYEDSLKQK